MEENVKVRDESFLGIGVCLLVVFSFVYVIVKEVLQFLLCIESIGANHMVLGSVVHFKHQYLLPIFTDECMSTPLSVFIFDTCSDVAVKVASDAYHKTAGFGITVDWCQ